MAAGTVTYQHPKTSAPAAADAKGMVVATVAFGAASNDDATDVTHAFGLDPADGSGGEPVVIVTLTAAGSAAKVPLVTYKDKDTVTITPSVKGANCDLTAKVTILRPHSIIS